jgi:hypothetical protein
MSFAPGYPQSATRRVLAVCALLVAALAIAACGATDRHPRAALLE